MKQYAILKNGKRTVKVSFDSYEKARQHIRKILRRMGQEAYLSTILKREDEENRLVRGMWDDISRNPTNFTEFGYSIRALQ